MKGDITFVSLHITTRLLIKPLYATEEEVTDKEDYIQIEHGHFWF